MSRNVAASESRTKAQAAAADNKKTPRTSKITDKHEAKKARREPKVKWEDGSSGERNSKKSRENCVRSALVERDLAGGGLTTTTDKEQGTVPTTTSPRLSASTSATTTMPPPAPTNRSTEAAGMAPSAEILLLRQARETAKKEVEATGSGKRPRAPSRRALEASGRMNDQGAQWMTRKQKAEETRVKTELREKRKQSKAAGLKLGVVLEEIIGGAAGTAAT